MQVQAGVSVFRQSRERAYWFVCLFVCLFVLFEHYRSSKAEMKNFVLRIRDDFCGHPLLNNELNAHFSKISKYRQHVFKIALAHKQTNI